MTETAIAIGVMVIFIPIRTAATTDAVLPAADSAAAVRVHCHPCPFGGLIGGIVVNNNTIAVDALAASLLPPLGAMDPTATSTTKTLDGTAAATAAAPAPAAMAATATATEEEEEECDGCDGADPRSRLDDSLLRLGEGILLRSKRSQTGQGWWR